MVWSRRVEDMIYRIYYKYGLCTTTHQTKEQAILKRICMNAINSNPEIKAHLTTDEELENFIMRKALGSVTI